MEDSTPSVIVAGSLNADIICTGVDRVAKPSGDTTSEPLRIEPGGKGRNIASMLSSIVDGGVEMLGRVSEDPHDLWKVPVKSLEEEGVSVEYVKKQSFEESGQYPGTALVVVDRTGDNMIYAAAGANYDFSPSDVRDAEPVFQEAAGEGYLVTTFEIPNDAVVELLAAASSHDIPAIIDPGAVKAGRDYSEVFSEDILVITPNEAEAQRLTGVEVSGLETAEEAARQLLERNVENVLITAGEEGAYLVNDEVSRHLKVPEVQDGGEVRDETGCGDQVTATLCQRLLAGDGIDEAAEKAVEAGTHQYFREGVQPVTGL